MPLTTAPRTRLGPHATPMRPWGAFTGKTETVVVEVDVCDEPILACAIRPDPSLSCGIRRDVRLACAIPDDAILELRC